MNSKTGEQIRMRMTAADPAARITSDELASSRERSLRVIRSSPATVCELDELSVLRNAKTPAATSSRLSRRSRRTRTWFVSAAAAAVLVALIGGDVVGLAGWRGGATAQAAEVLNSAAQTAITTIDPDVLPGQYLRIKSTNVWMTETIAEDGARYQWLDTEKFDMYVPADPAAEWVWQRSGRVPTTFFDSEAQDFVIKEGLQAHPELLRAPNGEFYGQPGGISTTDLSTFPRDPYRLLNNIYKQTLGKGQSVDGEAFVFIADLLRMGVVPADLRVALYKAAAMIPGVSITEGQANLDGRTGIAIGLIHGNLGERQEIIIDPRTGQLIGERQVITQDYGVIPAGTAISWTAVETSVTDAAL